jgi:hypothetical protein
LCNFVTVLPEQAAYENVSFRLRLALDKPEFKIKDGEHVYEVHPHKDHCGVDLISDALPFGRLWYDGPYAVANEIGYAEFFSRSHDSDDSRLR